MNRYFSLPFLLLLFCSCSMEEPEEDPNLLSEWKLIETFQEDQEKYKPTERKDILHFYADASVERSSSWCSKHNNKLADYSEENKVISIGCEEQPVALRYEIKGNLLFIYPDSTESFVLKYKRID